MAVRAHDSHTWATGLSPPPPERKMLTNSMRALVGLLTSWVEGTPEKSVLMAGWVGVSGKITRASAVRKGNKELKNSTLRSMEIGCRQKDEIL